MNRMAVKIYGDIWHKIDSLEKEIVGLKLLVFKKLIPSSKKIVCLKGILKGVNITDNDIEDAKKSLYNKVAI